MSKSARPAPSSTARMPWKTSTPPSLCIQSAAPSLSIPACCRSPRRRGSMLHAWARTAWHTTPRKHRAAAGETPSGTGTAPCAVPTVAAVKCSALRRPVRRTARFRSPRQSAPPRRAVYTVGIANQPMSLFFLPFLVNVLHGGDADLVKRLQNRDQRAMGDLYDRFDKLAFSVVLRIVRNQAIAEDLVQETFLRIWTRVDGFDPQRGSLSAWVLTVARNRAVDYLRSLEGRQQERTTELGRMDEPSVFDDVEKDLLNSDRARMLRDAFSRLNANQRTVIELAYFEGLSQSEMAERMKQPLGTIKTWVRTALQTMRQELVGVAAI